MSKDIRNYFGSVKGTTSTKSKNESHQQISKKRSRRVIESDDSDDDCVFVAQNRKSSKKSHSDVKKTTPSSSQKKSEVILQVEDFFGNTPIMAKREKGLSPKKSEKPKITPEPDTSKKKKSSKKKKEEKAIDDPAFECDDELERSFLNTDEELLVNGILSSAKKEKQSEEMKNHTIGKLDVEESVLKKSEKKLSPTKKSDVPEPIKTPKRENKSFIENPSSEQKRKNAEAYQKYLNRSGPKNPGSKEIPKGAPKCLQGLTFVITGILDSLEREEAVELIQKCEGRVTSQVSKKTDYVVVGEEPGASKIQKAKNFGTKKINEDELLSLIVERTEKIEHGKDVFIQGTPEKKSKYFNSDKIQKRPSQFKDDSLEAGISNAKIPKKEPASSFRTPKKESLKASDLSKTKSPKNEPSKNYDLSKKVSPKKKEKGVVEVNTDSMQRKITADFGTKCAVNRVPTSHNISEKPVFEPSSMTDNTLWVEKHKPKSSKTIVGQGGDRSNVKKLIHWLQNWHNNHSNKSGKKPTRPAPWAQNDDGSFYKAALLSGPPGVGKTTTIHLVCKELGLDAIEFNASDTRSKRLLQEDVTELLSSKSLQGFLTDKGKSTSNQVLVMDEVDGMAGNEDRGGVQELIQLIKQTKIPIVGICNDRSHPKMRSLVNYCFDLRFQRPNVKQIKAAMMSVCVKENINISPEALEELIVSSNHDLRQVLNRLSLLTFADKSLSIEDAKKNGIDAKKPLSLGPWEVARKVFSASDQEGLSINDKMELFFQDYSLGPLFIQDTYLHVKPYKARDERQILALFSNAADSIAMGDVVERTIRNQSAWSLLPVQAIFSSVLPGHYMSGHVQGRIEFPEWFGKNSKANKFSRILKELHTSLCNSISGDSMSVNLDYLPSLKDNITRPLITKGSEGVEEAVKFMLEYNLIREDLDHILELSSWPGVNDAFSNVESKVKAAFTRALNKESRTVSHTIKKISSKEYENDLEAEEEEENANEETENVDSDPMIKKGKPKKSTKTEAAAKGTTAKKETTKKRKGKEKK